MNYFKENSQSYKDDEGLNKELDYNFHEYIEREDLNHTGSYKSLFCSIQVSSLETLKCHSIYKYALNHVVFQH